MPMACATASNASSTKSSITAGSQRATKRRHAIFSRWSCSPPLWSGCETWSKCQQDLVRLGTGEPNHLAPLLGFVGDKLAEIGGRSREQRGTKSREPHLRLGISENRVHRLVDFVAALA